MGELLTVEAEDGLASLFLPPALCFGETLAHKASRGGGAFLLHWRGLGFGSESQTVRHGPWAQDFLVFPAKETRGSSPPLPDVNSPSSEWVSFSVWEDMTSAISPLTLSF